MSAPRTRSLFYRRAFLNKPRHESTALVLAEARGGTGELEADLSIGDCSRKVVLNFSVWAGYGEHHKVNHADIANVRHKSAELRKTVNEFLDAVELGLCFIEDGEA